MRRLLIVIAVGLALLATPAYAHGFGGRLESPLPVGLSLAAAAAAVALSFVIVSLFVRPSRLSSAYPRYDLLRLRWFRLTLANRWTVRAARALSVSLLALVVSTGVFGDQNPARNFAPTFVWILWWIGLAFLTPFVGNLWAVLNPWKAIYEGLEALFMRGRGPLSVGLQYPRKAGVWPAVALFLAFAWVENVSPFAATPLQITRMALAYSLITWTGMLVFGKQVWLHYGEAFNVFYGFLARFAPTELRVTDRAVCDACPLDCREESECVNCSSCWERSVAVEEKSRRLAPSRRGPRGKGLLLLEPARQFNLRPFALSLARGERVGWDRVVFVLLMLATVSFDGLSATPVWSAAAGKAGDLLSVTGSADALLVQTLGLAVLPGMFTLAYLGFAYLIGAFAGEGRSVGVAAKGFVYSLIPIALAYHLSHFLGVLVFQGLRIIPLASDPYGFGWDLFGTAGYAVTGTFITTKVLWYFSVGAIVLGHIISVYLAHVAALRLFQGHRQALRSQYPMLLLMVGYTVSSLWILAQPIVK
ncbi:MAG: hypothetical protein HY681_14930 [Chloroflexi bacterium]|nr:hypothetical protein [Chloroflexota bacterium]